MKILIVVDMQNDFIEGPLGTKEAQGIVNEASLLVEKFKKNGYPVIFTRDTHSKGYLNTREGKRLPIEHCIKGTRGWEITDKINTNNCTIINKSTFGYKRLPNVLVDELKEYLKKNGIKNSLRLKNLEEIVIVGLCTDICVISNAMLLKAAFPDNDITVFKDCCAGVTEKTHQNALNAMEMCQIDIK
jgi:nicotinamidase-related amidase